MRRLAHHLSCVLIHIVTRIPVTMAAAFWLLCAGQAAAQTVDPFLGVPILTSGASTPGGTVTVVNVTDKATTGDGAHALVGNASAGGYAQSVIDSLTNFSADPFSFETKKVWNADLSLGTPGAPATGTRVDAEGNVLGGPGGSFVLNENGTFTFEPGTDFADLADGAKVLTSIRYEITGTNTSTDPPTNKDCAGTLVVEVTKSADGSTISHTVVGADFEDFGSFRLPESVFPDLKAYVTSMLQFSYSGGPGSDLEVTNEAALATGGKQAHGIFAIAQGQRGTDGRDASFTRSSRRGGAGGDGGDIAVTANGTMTTSGYQSAGVVATSVGGNGGTGGDAGWWWDASSGGRGGNGGQVTLFGGATIQTTGEGGVGVLALSQGGNGGAGGSGATFWGASNGAQGGAGGTVIVDGTWNITTSGKDAYGIYAKSLGGVAGSGGNGGWTGTDAGGGGQGTEGGSVTVINRGQIVTSGENAHGIFAQSIGGFGGSGGSGGSVFYASGGSGEGAGSGGNVSVTNDVTGSIFTSGTSAHGIFAQSIGGGGGSGGSGSALVGFGGTSSSGGNGGTVAVTNRGGITTTGQASRGIYAQSVGGGGGDGGNAYGLGAIGGQGSATSDGGNVSVTNTGTISSTHNAILAQSIGGGGGNGGSSSGWFSFGGSGGSGGNAGTAAVSNHGNLATSENNASAILAQSLGGGGGNGGNSVSVGAFIAVGIGGKGGSGGTGAEVRVGVNTGTGDVDPVTGTITTTGKNANGIQAQSIGGGGGNGGFAVSASVGYGASASFGIGGSGGGGKNAGATSVYFGDPSSLISTSGENAHGIFAQSVGGGGGAGGFSIAAAVSDTFSAAISVGGKGGDGGNGSSVIVGSTANPLGGHIQTSGTHSYGLFAQSSGGGGGTGGMSIGGTASTIGLSFAMGGSGGGGGAGAGVSVNSGTSIATQGADSHALFAQSVGGGGGAGAFSVAAGVSATGAVNVGFGGTGGSGGNAGSVSLQSTGAIGTLSDRSHGIFAQSVGGGGGAGGFSVAAGISQATASFSMGGKGGGGGTGANVTVTSSSSIGTQGADSHGLFAQSVGGGGGAGGFSVAVSLSTTGAVNVGLGGGGGLGGNAGSVSLQSTGAIATLSDRSHGIFAQSVGGGGGSGGFSIASGASKATASFSMGGWGGGGGAGANVSVTSSSSIGTHGADSHGLFAQSVGGGGGAGGFSVAASLSTEGGINVGFGGGGGLGGNAGIVSLQSTGAIGTLSDRSHGIFAQSVGGGGGSGGFSIAAGASKATASFSMGGTAGGGGAGANVSVTSSSSIGTHGADSHGLFAQSVGGGGGAGGFSVAASLSTDGNVNVGLGGKGGLGGNAGSVSLQSTGAIGTLSDRSNGIFAQSVGGGGGAGGFSIAAGISKGQTATFSMGGSGGGGGVGADVTVTSSSAIDTRGANSHALFAQSVGGGGGTGGWSLAGGLTMSSSINVGVGGGGGSGGGAGRVTLLNSGTIWTTGNHSDGIIAQSVGGGGGDGGFTIAAGLSKGTSASFGIGGWGATGGQSKAVSVTNSGAVTTSGQASHALFAQSVGGGGGNGGFAISGTFSMDTSLSFSLGGGGGTGQNGNTVTLNNTGAIATGGATGAGKGSHGLFAQSIGGGGGNGGFAGSFTGSFGNNGTALSMAVGGWGGAAGAANAVNVSNNGTVTTTADDSIGLYAQSIGGGGGNGGFGLSVSLATSQQGASGGMAIGGSGNSGGAGSTVTVTNNQFIQTAGNHSQGILAQSIGGGGGNGGFAINAAGGTGDQAKNISIAVGGGGAGGGSASSVSLTNNAGIATIGNDSSAVHAQSIGGGGGNGGFSVSGAFGGTSAKSLSASIGGWGGGGGAGGAVNIFGNAAGAITTRGERSNGILAQSIGGGGGNGGFAGSIALGVGGEDKSSTAFTLSVGGFGGTGNTGGAVNAGTNSSVLSGNVTTLGDESIGILAQSIGGGGGTGGFAVSGSVNLAAGQGSNNALAFTVGGFGGTGNNGGTVGVNHSGAIDTSGDGSHGIQAQSIGGGGGNGGSARSFTLQLGSDPPEDKDPAKNKSLNVAIGGWGAGGGNGGAVTVINVGNITTRGGDAHGLFAQSIGGGGGTGGDGHTGVPDEVGNITDQFDQSDFKKSLSIAVGGSGGASGSGGSVSLSNTGAITTYGVGSHGVFAQSIGGGGGAGGAGNIGPVDISLQIGGGTGDGNDVSATLAGSISTYGQGAMGIVAQSVGGGGGMAGGAEQGLANYTNVGIGLVFGDSAGGNGGKVDVNSTANIFTQGTGSNGIFAQSIGGGGGVLGRLNVDLPLLSVMNFAGSVGGSGSGGQVNVTQTGNIMTTGDAATGIFAQSAGGTATGGAVNVTLNSGNISATGAESNGIFAQSIGQGGNGNVSVTIANANSFVVGGSNTGAAVRFADGNNNTLASYGTLTTAGEVSGTTIVGAAGNETVNNYGAIIGSIDLGTGTNALNNKAGGLFIAGSSINLGAGSMFTNSGTLSLGGTGYTRTTTLTGDFTQSGAPTWLVDIGHPGISDTMTITGHAHMDGSVTTVNIKELTLPAGTGTYTLASAQGGLLGTQFKFGTLDGDMPIGRTFDFLNSDTTQQLTLNDSTGTFHWKGALSNTWATSFVNGVSNWTRTAGGSDYIFGTPGAGSDVIFSDTSTTVMGANFAVKSLQFAGASSHTLSDSNSLTLQAGGGRGVTVGSGSAATLDVNIVLGSNQTWLNDGSLTVGGPTITGSGRNLTIDGSGATTIGAAIQTGAGALTKAGTGLLTLTGANTYSGGTTITGGTLLGDATSLQGNILNQGILVFDQSGWGTYAGSLTGGGLLKKQGSGSLLLTGNSSLFAGSTTLAAGQMFVDGRLGGASLELKPGTLLGGHGEVPSLTIQDGAVLSPGNSIGTITVTGDVTFNSGSIYRVETGAPLNTNPYSGSSDLTVASGTLSPQGGVVEVVAGGETPYRPINMYLIFATGNHVAGRFSGGSTSDVPYLIPSLQYRGNDVYLVLRRNNVDFRSAGTTGNQTAVALMLNGLVSRATGGLAAVVNNVYDLPKSRALGVMTSMTGLLHQYVARSGLDASRIFTTTSAARLGVIASGGDRLVPNSGLTAIHLQQATDGPPTRDRYRGWIRTFGADTTYAAAGVDAGARALMRGQIVGFDAAISNRLTLGVSGGQTRPQISIEGAGDHASASMVQLGGYGRYADRHGRLDVLFGIGRFDNRTFRQVTDGFTTLVAQSKYRGGSVSGQIEYGYTVRLGRGFDIEPGAALQVGRLHVDAFNEAGADVLALSAPARSGWSTRVLAGSRASKSLGRLGGLRVMLEGRAAWSRELTTLDDLLVHLRGDSLATFRLSPPKSSRNGGIFGVGLGGALPGGFRLFADVDTETSGAIKIWRGNAGMTRTW